MKHFLIIICILLSATCVTFDEKVSRIKALNDVYIDDILTQFTSGQYAKVMQDILFLKAAHPELPQGLLTQLEAETLDKMTAAFTEKLAANNYQEAFALYQSLQTLGKAPTDWNESKLLLQLAEQYAADNNPLCALFTGIRLIKSRDTDRETIEKILTIAYNSNNRSALRIIIQTMDERGFPVDEKFRTAAAVYPSKAEMLKGTAIIWVDMGIRLERGMGLPERALGSGFFIDKRGYLLTNYHVIQSEVDPKYEGYSRLYIRLSKDVDQKIPTKVIGYDRIFDLALLKVEITPEFIFDSIGTAEVVAGDKVYAIGSPLDPFLQNTITAGIISAAGRRRLLQMGDIVQVDAPVNPGNSGGPLISEKNGELLGIVFAGLEAFEGLNFAITYNWVQKMLTHLYATGEVKHPWLGMAIDETEYGLQVIYPLPGAAAARSGIAAGDIILALNDKPYTSIRDIQENLLDFSPGTLVKVTWKHADKVQSNIICLSERPFSPIESALEKDLQQNVYPALFGMSIEWVNNFLWQTNYRVTRVIPGSAADDIGLSVNDALNLQGWNVDKENRVAFLQIYVKKKKAAYFESFIQLGAYLENDQFI